MPTPPPMQSARPGGNQFRGMAERPGDVGNGLTRFQRHQFLVLLPTDWMTSAMVPAPRVHIGDRQGESFRALAPVHNHKLAGLPDLRDARRDNVQPGHVRAQLGFADDAMHA